MCVDKTGNQRFTFALDGFGGSGFLNLPDLLNDSIVVDADRCVSENLTLGVLCDDPVAIFQEESQ